MREARILTTLGDLLDGAGRAKDAYEDLKQAADIAATGLAPTNNAESAILTSLAPGTYTAIVSGKGSRFLLCEKSLTD